MARKRRVFIDEDLGRVIERIYPGDDIDDARQADYRRFLARLRGLDAMVHDIKATWIQLAATLEADEATPFSLRKYAREIPWRLSVLQNQVRAAAFDPPAFDAAAFATPEPSSTLENLIVFALLTGQVMTEGRFRLEQVPTLRLGRKRLEQLRMAGQESGRERRDRARDSDAQIRAACRAIRTKHPYDRQHTSTRWLALQVSLKLHRTIGRAVLRRLNLE